MKITLNIPSVYECEGVSLKPGANDVADNVAKKFLANKLVAADIEAGKLTVESTKKLSKAAAKKIADDEAKALQDAADEAELERLQAEEDASNGSNA